MLAYTTSSPNASTIAGSNVAFNPPAQIPTVAGDWYAQLIQTASRLGAVGETATPRGPQTRRTLSGRVRFCLHLKVPCAPNASVNSLHDRAGEVCSGKRLAKRWSRPRWGPEGARRRLEKGDCGRLN